MKKIFLFGILIIISSLAILLINDLVLAHGHYPHYHFGIFVAPPVIWWALYPYYYRPWYPPFEYRPYYYRDWIPGHWEWHWDPYRGCWRRVWIPGYWYYRDYDP